MSELGAGPGAANNTASRRALIWAMVRKDLSQIRHNGLRGLILTGLFIGLLGTALFGRNSAYGDPERQAQSWVGESEYSQRVDMIREKRFSEEGAAAGSGADQEVEPEVQSGPFAGRFETLSAVLLDFAYGFSALVVMLMTCLAYGTNYGNEIRRGTIRTLMCYPVGLQEITAAKVVYAAIVGGVGGLIVLLGPWIASGLPILNHLATGVTAWFAAVLTLAAGAFGANAIAARSGRMRVRPTTLGVWSVLLAFLFTRGLTEVGLRVMISGEGLVAAMKVTGPLVLLSPFHEAGGLLSAAMGGPGPTAPWALLLPVAVIVIGWRASRRVYPDCFGRD